MKPSRTLSLMVLVVVFSLTLTFSTTLTTSLPVHLAPQRQSQPQQSQQQPPQQAAELVDVHDLVFTTLLEITAGIKENALRSEIDEQDAATPTPLPATNAPATTFLNLLSKMKQNLIEQQQDEIDQFTKEQALCDEKIKMIGSRIKITNDTLVQGTKEISKKKARIEELKPQINKIVSQLKPKANDLEVIVKTIEQGSRRRYAQLSSNTKKINETADMIAMIDQLAVQLAATLGATTVNASNVGATTFKFREQIKEMGNRITDPALQSLLASALTLADTSASTSADKSAALESLNKLQKLLVLLDKEMHDYLAELKQSEEMSAAAWQKVLTTFAAERAMIQKDVQAMLSNKKVATDEVEKLTNEIKSLNDKIAELPQKLSVLVPQLTSWKEQCRMKREFYDSQSKNRQDQLSTIDAVNKVTSTLQGSALQQALDQVADGVQKSRSK